ncbi:hypothetical protein JCM5350_007175 [Sporobolomyces pararoseus]
MDQYLIRVHQAYTSSNVPLLTNLLSPLPESTSFIQLRQTLLSSPHLRPTSYRDTTRSKFSNPQQTPFADYLSNHLIYVRDTPLEVVGSCTKEGLEKSLELLEDLYKTGDRLFATSETGYFVETLRLLTRQLIKTALLHGKITKDSKLTKAGEAARMLARPMGIAASDKSIESPPHAHSGGSSVRGKKTALYFLANQTFKVYFALKNLRLCDTVLNNVNNSNVSLESGMFVKGDQSEFWYYRGRINLYQRRLRAAKKDLEKSLINCNSSSWKNARLILIYLITASIPLGYFPKYDVLKHFNLDEPFGPGLIEPLKKGHWSKVLSHLNLHKAFHLKHGNYSLLVEKLETICWRNLTRQTLLVSTNGNPSPTNNGPPTLSLQLLLTSAKYAWKSIPSSTTSQKEEEEEEDLELDLDDIESMTVSLMDQGYLKAYIMHSKRLLVLQKGKHFGFPPLSSIA